MSIAGHATLSTARVLATFVSPRGRTFHATRLIARGGMAEVYAGFEPGPDGETRPVAIKRLDAADVPEALLAFDDEARIVASLAHPGIVSLLDYGLDGDRPFQALEHVDGLDLRLVVERARARGRAIPPALVLEIVAAAADAVHAAHVAHDEAGRPLEVIHRDLTPHNILLSWAGEVKIADFGIALWSDRSAYTAPGLVKGKLPFMAPEQLLGRALDRRVDVFALGCVLAYAFTGASPYASQGARTRGLRGLGPELDAEVPSAAASLVAIAAAPDRDLRYGTAIELALACRRAARTCGPAPRLAAWLAELERPATVEGPEPTPVPTVLRIVDPAEPSVETGRSAEQFGDELLLSRFIALDLAEEASATDAAPVPRIPIGAGLPAARPFVASPLPLVQPVEEVMLTQLDPTSVSLELRPRASEEPRPLPRPVEAPEAAPTVQLGWTPAVPAVLVRRAAPTPGPTDPSVRAMAPGGTLWWWGLALTAAAAAVTVLAAVLR